MTNECIKKLESYGFKRYATDCELLYAFKNPAYCYSTKMLVQGSHATDYAELIYANEENFKGLCYASSLMESLMLNFKDHHIERIIRKINRITDTHIELKNIGGYPMVVSECNENDFESEEIKYHISDMLKTIGVLDCLLQQRQDYLQKQKAKKNKSK